MWRDKIRIKRFGEFYLPFCERGIKLWDREQESFSVCLELKKETVAECCYERLKQLPLRTLIYEMHSFCEAGKLKGETDRQKYEYYRRTILTSPIYLDELSRKYPELFRLMELRLRQTVARIREAAERLEKDRKEITEKLCGGNGFGGVRRLDMEGADSHNGRRTVIKIELDQGQRIIYKPYGVEKEWLYHQLSGRVYRRMGMEELELPYLCRDGYGWEPWLEHRACQDTGQVRRYFKRMGVHLFLAHLLSATDLHGENVMAVGEFPVIIDTETFPGLRFFDETADADHRVRDMIRYSVLRTGLLPGESWAGAAVNAIHSPGEQVLPFKIPVVEQDGTVKMRIGYSQARVNLKNSLPILDGYPVEPYGYREEVCSGFSAAYALWIEEKKEWSGYVHRFYQQPFRIVRRNTQQYAAFLSASLHPQYLMSAQKRRIFLERLHSRERGEDKSELKMEEYEIDALMDMDIPVFSGRGDSCSIFTGDGREYENYFPCQPDLAYMEESKFFTKTDCSIQQTMIRLSFERLRREKAEKTVREEKEKTVSWEEIMGRQVDEIGEYLFNTAVFDEKGTPAWMGVLGQPDGSWRCEPIGFDLYDGIPGIVIFLQQLTAVRSDEKYKDLLYSAKVRLFQYTEEWKKRQESGMTFEGVDEERTGAFFGVASGAYAYLILYHISGDREYLDYANCTVNCWRIIMKKTSTMILCRETQGRSMFWENCSR